MSGISVKAIRARATLACDKCGTRWESVIYEPRRWGDENRAAAPAFALGWRVYNAGRGHRTYCPDHGPSVPMMLIHGSVEQQTP